MILKFFNCFQLVPRGQRSISGCRILGICLAYKYEVQGMNFFQVPLSLWDSNPEMCDLLLGHGKF